MYYHRPFSELVSELSMQGVRIGRKIKDIDDQLTNFNNTFTLSFSGGGCVEEW